MTDEILHTPQLSGSGQLGKCVHCNKYPIVEGNEVYDGCLGKLDTDVVANSCCGHGDDSGAYVQFWDWSCIRGKEAVELQKILKGSNNEN